jgi:hypothetical protein
MSKLGIADRVFIVLGLIALVFNVFMIGFTVRGTIDDKAQSEPDARVFDDIRATTAVITGFNFTDDTVICADSAGNIWEFEGIEDWCYGDVVTLLFDTQKTKEIFDDEIIRATYNAWELTRHNCPTNRVFHNSFSLCAGFYPVAPHSTSRHEARGG